MSFAPAVQAAASAAACWLACWACLARAEAAFAAAPPDLGVRLVLVLEFAAPRGKDLPILLWFCEVGGGAGALLLGRFS